MTRKRLGTNNQQTTNDEIQHQYHITFFYGVQKSAVVNLLRLARKKKHARPCGRSKPDPPSYQSRLHLLTRLYQTLIAFSAKLTSGKAFFALSSSSFMCISLPRARDTIV